METKPVYKTSTEDANRHEEWFANFINVVSNKIKTDKKNLESGDASQETISIYRSLMEGDVIELASSNRKQSSQILIKEIVISYISLLEEKNVNYLKLAFDMSSNKVLVWAEINDNDEKSEMSLIRIESIINAKFSLKTGIELDSIIVEKEDNLEIPSHYQNLDVA